MMDINTDLTRGRVFAGKSFANPQTRSASIGGYYGYYHSVRNTGSLAVGVQDLKAGEADLHTVISGMRSRDRVPAASLDHRNVMRSLQDVAEHNVWPSVPPFVPSLGEFIRFSGDTRECLDYRTFGEDHYDPRRRDRSMEGFLKTNRPVRDYNKFFILHGSFFFELESGNMETPSGRLAYDSDETHGSGGTWRILARDTEVLASVAEAEYDSYLMTINDMAASRILEEMERITLEDAVMREAMHVL